jgi:hypothetical protein
MSQDFNDFDEFDNDYEQILYQQSKSIDHDYYGEDYDPNNESYYDLDIYSLNYAKSLFHTLGSSAKYKGFNLIGHKCREGAKLGCTQQEYERYEQLKKKIDKGYPLSLDDSVCYYIPPEQEALRKELDELRQRCVFGTCEPCSTTEYNSYIEQYRNHTDDEPLGLYHKNNQTILDPVNMPSNPVDPKLFVAKVTSELEAVNVFVSDAMPELLDQMCRLFNFTINPNKKLPRSVKNLVFPAQTGVGKSVSVQVYVSMLTKHSSLIVVSKVEEAIKYCKYINKVADNDNLSRCYYALTDKNKDDAMRADVTKLSSYPCIVITHNMFRRVNGFDNVDYFSMYEEQPRDFISIDEKLSFHQSFQLDYKDLDQLIENVESAIEQVKQLSEVPTSHDALASLKDFKDLLLFKEDKIVTNDTSIVIKKELSPNVVNQLEKIGEDVSLSRLSYKDKTPLKLINLKNKEVIAALLRSHGVPVQARKRNVIGISSRDIEEVGVSINKNVAPFYCERFVPPIFNCLSDGVSNSAYSFECTCDSSLNCSCGMAMDYNNLSEKDIAKITEVKRSRNEQYGLELVSSILKVLFEVRVDETLAILERLDANKNKAYRQNTLNAINVKLDALRYFCKNNFLIYKANNRKALLATETLVNKLGLSVVLDATAQFNEYYQLANRFLGHVGFVSAPQIRQYQNLTIHKAKGFNQSRSALYRDKTYDELSNIAKSYASYAMNELAENDKMLIICHKDFVDAIKKQVNDSRVEYTHWGNHIGRNKWARCNKVMLIGWNHLPPTEHVAAINASLESVLLTSRHLDNELIEKFAISQLADDIVQGLMRSQARVIASEDSDCKPSDFYLFYNDDTKSNKVLEIVETQFPLASIVDWIPSGKPIQKRKSKRTKKDDEVIALLVNKAKDHETYLRKDLQDELGINKSTMGRIIAREYFKSQMKKYGIDYRNKDGKSQQFVLK